ncbi:MAG TPA: efflux RND transporter periplasmic adaptor subunit [Burkholderiaceae bacterium]|jgi:membrane fusion protein (multidrug efflux system)
MTKRMFIMLGFVLLIVVVLGGLFAMNLMKMFASFPKPAPQTITAMKVESLEWQPQLSAVGSVAPVRGVDVTTEIAGLVREVHFKSGDEVKKGQLLVQLNDDSEVAQMHSLQAAADLAATVLNRDKLQLSAQAIAQSQVDADEADLKSKRALVEQQKATIVKKAIRAPFSGQIGITTVNPGQYLNPGDKIVSLEQIDPIYVNFTVPQKQVASVGLKQKVNATTDAFAGTDFPGAVTSLDPKIDTATRNVALQATLSNAKHQLLPGMFANVKVDQGDKKKYLTLPQTAITYNPYGSTIFIVRQDSADDKDKACDKKDDKKDPKKDDKAEKTDKATAPAETAPKLFARQVFVTTGATRGDQVAVLTGIRDGDMVATSGQLKLKNCTWVVIDNKVTPKNDVNPTPQEQ